MIDVLDNLYQPGTYDALYELLNTILPVTNLVSVVIADGTGDVLVECYWDGALLRITCKAQTVNFDYLSTTCGPDPDPNHDTYKHLCEVMPDFFCSRGVHQFTTEPGSPEAMDVLFTAGAWTEQGNQLVWSL